MPNDTIFEVGTSALRFGPGATAEIGMDLADWGVRRVLVLTDPNLVDLPPVQVALGAMRSAGLEPVLFDRVHVEPTDASFREAIDAALGHSPDAFVAIGGGSTMDTAKAANLYSTWPDDLFAYINAPIGQGNPVPGPLKPLIAVPTTAGTGSETTGVAILDLLDRHVKTGIAHRRLKPTLAVVDPDNTRTMPKVIAACSGLDVLCHALESYTAIPFDTRPKPERPVLRPAYQGSNPLSDIWALEAIGLAARYLVRAVQDPGDDEARSAMMRAASIAGIGFGNAGVHLCHGMSYPVSAMVRDFRPAGLVTDHAIIPHGMAVALHAPAVFSFTGPACPARHLEAARRMGADPAEVTDLEAEAGPFLARQLVALMKTLEIPNGLAAVGFTAADIPALVEGTLPQHRVTKLSPRPAGAGDLASLFGESMRLW
ncbi:MAG: hydroxyacid-oxoacid transhydrogenase [Candidatus Latescibacterota bacterium]